jgi:SAM-dependent methyltransferase
MHRMTDDLPFTGERYVPGTPGEIAHEHWHRYAFTRAFVDGRRVLDVACGEGYGAAFLAEAARFVVGVDIDEGAVAHARDAYGARDNVRFVRGSAAALPLAAGTIDAVVSFETIEHLRAADQARMLAEFARVLAPDGVLILSSPNRPEYSEARAYVNPYHLHELDRDELTGLLAADFPAQRWYRQRRWLGSALWSEDRSERCEALQGGATTARPLVLPAAMYFVVIAARNAAALPASPPGVSLFTDDDDAEWKRIEHEAAEVLRLDKLLAARDAHMGEQARFVHELEEMVWARDRTIADAREQSARDRAANAQELAAAREAFDAERARFEAQIAAQERLIAYRGSLRWWALLPWVRARTLWNRVRLLWNRVRPA